MINMIMIMIMIDYIFYYDLLILIMIIIMIMITSTYILCSDELRAREAQSRLDEVGRISNQINKDQEFRSIIQPLSIKPGPPGSVKFSFVFEGPGAPEPL